MKKFKRLLICTLLLSAFACSKNDEIFFSANDEIVFQFEYLNYAWGKQHRGFYITANGTKYSYDNLESWIFPEESLIKAVDFGTNLSVCTNDGTVDLSKLNRMKTLVLSVDEKQLTKAKNEMYDAGSESYSFYVKDAAKGVYRQITLLNRGDWYQENSDKDAQEIANWLIELNNGGIFKE